MARFNLIQIGSIYITSTGLVDGSRCKSEVTGLDPLRLSRRVSIIKAIDGTPYRQLSESEKGIDFQISIDWVAKTVYDNILNLFDDSNEDGTFIAISVDGDTGTYSVNAIPQSDPVSSEGFSGGIIKKVKFKMVTT